MDKRILNCRYYNIVDDVSRVILEVEPEAKKYINANNWK